jgi:hypothetical protein
MERNSSNEYHVTEQSGLPTDDREPTWDEIRTWAEFYCWATLILAPIINWLNGPAVSNDQLIVRTGLIVVAMCGGIGLRLSTWFKA